jgi:spore photoproduct lyase
MSLSQGSPSEIFRVGTGELGDSLALEPVVPLAGRLIGSLRSLDNVILELKTKSNHVDCLLDVEHGGKVIVSWSLAPEGLTRREEPGTASLAERLEAAVRVEEAGYRLGFHLDPIVRYPGWEDDYRLLLDRLFDSIEPGHVVWLSFGCLRFPPALKEIVLDRIQRPMIFLDEFVPCPDGKMRYLRAVREDTYGKVMSWIRDLAPGLEVYLCMESPLVWENVFGVKPSGNGWLSGRLDLAALREGSHLQAEAGCS